MLSLFSTVSDKAGFRLQYMEVYNWGTFNKDIYRISPKGNNSLLTGANASGKSTFIDALLTLLVPVKKDRFYNQSSGADKKGDRTEETYVLGNYGNIQREGEYSTSTQSLRDKNDYSVILVSFSNTDHKTITLFQLRWFTNGELKRVFGVAHMPLEIEKDLSQFDGKGQWKKRLEKIYNSNTNKRKIEFFDSPNLYAERIANLFGMLSTKALSLFNQVVGVKVLADLDEFIRTNMLEERSDIAETEYIQLKESFITLMDAKKNIEKAKEQIVQLTPINEMANQLSNIQNELIELNQSKEIAVYWFSKKYVELAEIELERYSEKLKDLEIKLKDLRVRETSLKEEEAQLVVAIERDEVGSKIRELERDIARFEKSRDSRKGKLEDYNRIAQNIELDRNPDETVFRHNREKAKKQKQDIENRIELENRSLRSLENKDEKIEITLNELISTIQTLQQNKSNIAGREAEIRDEILQHLGATKDEIPFVGELIKVNEAELEWESSIEKILHNFALRLVVPKKYYSKLNEYVNTHNLKGRIRYDKFEEQDYLKNFQSNSVSENSLLNKIDIKPKTKYHDWIENSLSNQFNFACVESLVDFNLYPEMAVTKSGLIKFKNGRHEKDDRLHISRRENYVLGWNNKDKIALLKKELLECQKSQKENKSAILSTEIHLKKLSSNKDECHNLFSKFDSYDEIDWKTYADQIQSRIDQKSQLEKTNDRVKQLQDRQKQVKGELKELTENSIFKNNEEIFNFKRDFENVKKQKIEKQNLINSWPEVDASIFEISYPELLNLQYDDLLHKQGEFQTENSDRISQLNVKKRAKEDELRIKINRFKNPEREITDRFIDWRSDVNGLPDSTHLELIGEYQQLLGNLEKDNLPRFEAKWNELLQTTITDKIGSFRVFFTDWEESIKLNIGLLNESLKEINFKNSPATYIQIIPSVKRNDEVSEFRRMLDNAVPNIRELDSVVDGRKNHFINNIQPLIEKLDKEDYRRRVMEVRTWNGYKAEEFYKETGQKLKTYENMGQLSGGEKAQLTYTILGSAIAYQFGLTKEGLQTNSFRFIAIDEAFKAQDEEKARYLITLCKQLHLQLLVVTPSDNIHIVENDISFVHFVERKEEKYSLLYDMPIEVFRQEKEKYLVEE